MAVAAFPVQEPEEPETLPVTLPVSGPENAVAVSVPLSAFQVKDFATVLVPAVTLALVTE